MRDYVLNRLTLLMKMAEYIQEVMTAVPISGI